MSKVGSNSESDTEKMFVIVKVSSQEGAIIIGNRAALLVRNKGNLRHVFILRFDGASRAFVQTIARLSPRDAC